MTTNRREFLQAAAIAGAGVAGAGLAGAGLPAIAGATGAETQATANGFTPRLNLHSFIVDGRHTEARNLGSRLARAGTAVHTISDGDITQLWLSEIGPAWRQQPVAIAGLTARPALFCLEQLALSSGLRVVFHGEHIVHADGRVEHSILRGAADAQLSVRELTRAGALWPTRVAEGIALHRQQASPLRLARSDSALDPALPPGAQLLTSWIIAAA
jgi:hypothetical protein